LLKIPLTVIVVRERSMVLGVRITVGGAGGGEGGGGGAGGGEGGGGEGGGGLYGGKGGEGGGGGGGGGGGLGGGLGGGGGGRLGGGGLGGGEGGGAGQVETGLLGRGGVIAQEQMVPAMTYISDPCSGVGNEKSKSMGKSAGIPIGAMGSLQAWLARTWEAVLE
jgi:hypothetical protein